MLTFPYAVHACNRTGDCAVHSYRTLVEQHHTVSCASDMLDKTGAALVRDVYPLSKTLAAVRAVRRRWQLPKDLIRDPLTAGLNPCDATRLRVG